MTICNKCGRKEFIPFECSHCHGLFCTEHRLPERHGCPFLRSAKPISKP